jgi:hypothetical protein
MEVAIFGEEGLLVSFAALYHILFKHNLQDDIAVKGSEHIVPGMICVP